MVRTIKPLPMLAILAVIVLAAAGTTKATPTVFTMRNNATTPALGLCSSNPSNCANNITFEEPGYPTNPSLVPSITQLGVVFSSPGSTDGMGKVEVIPGSFIDSMFSNVLMSFTPNGSVYDLLITLPSGTTAVGFNLTNANNPGASFDIFVNGTPFALATTYRSFTFFGVTDPNGIQMIRILNPSGGTGGAPVIDDFTFGPAAPPSETPEAASMILMGTGLIGLSTSLRRRRNAAKKRGSESVNA